MWSNFLYRILPRVCGTGGKRSSSLLLSLASVYLWDEEGIGRQDFNHTIREFWRMYRGHHLNNYVSHESIKRLSQGTGDNDGSSDGESAGPVDEEPMDEDTGDEEWEAVIVKDHFQVYRKLVPGSSYLYQYKIFGTYDDIPAKAFFLVQLDTKFRKVWDKLVVRLDVVDAESKVMRKDPDYESLIDRDHENFDSKNQVIHWVMHYPYPMYCREYCYVRRAVIDRRKNLMILVSKSTDHPSCRQSTDYVRVSAYDSRMVIRPHHSLHDNGFDYLLTYFDDPQSSFPSAAYNWMAYSGVPDFVSKLHAAAVRRNDDSIRNRKGIRPAHQHVVHEDKDSSSNNNNRGIKQDEGQPAHRGSDTGSNENENGDVHQDNSQQTNSDSKTSRPSGKTTPLAASGTPKPSTGSGGRIAGSGSSPSSIRVDGGHSVFHGWTTFFSR